MTATQPPANAGRTRSTGALESSVLGILWQSLAELSVREVQAQLSAPVPATPR